MKIVFCSKCSQIRILICHVSRVAYFAVPPMLRANTQKGRRLSEVMQLLLRSRGWSLAAWASQAGG